MNTDIESSYKKDGFVLIKKVFTSEEVNDFRLRVSKLPKEVGDILSLESIRDVLLDERVLHPIRTLLGGKIVYFGDTAVRNEMEDGYRTFHQDSQLDFEDPSRTEYPILRIGIYLQDHSQHSGGLKVRKGSHRHVFIGRQNIKRFLFGKPYGPLSWKAFRLGKSINLNIETGDMVIWNLRTWHSGYAVRLKLMPSLSLNPRIEKYIPKWMTLPDTKPRGAFFASFGAPSETLNVYIKDRAAHPSNQAHWRRSHFNDSSVIHACQGKNIDLRFDVLQNSSGNQIV